MRHLTPVTILLSFGLWACASDDEPKPEPVDSTASPPDSAAPTDTAAPVDTAPYVPPTGSTYALHVVGAGWGPYGGDSATLALTWVGDPTAIAWTDTVVMPIADTIDWTFDGALVAGGAYVLTFYVDLDGDGRCSGPPTDHVWSTEPAGAQGGLSMPIGPVTGDVTLSIPATHNYDFDGCEVFASSEP